MIRERSAMKTQPQFARIFLPLLVGSGFLLVLGCSSDDGVGKRYAVSGKVTYKGAPVEKGNINFVTEKEGRGASGRIENGSYSLTTLIPGDGVMPGTYRVTVESRDIDQAEAKAATKKYFEKMGYKGESSIIPPEVQAKLMAKAKNTVPEKYKSPQTTDLKATVEARSMTIDFELKE